MGVPTISERKHYRLVCHYYVVTIPYINSNLFNRFRANQKNLPPPLS